jgi:HAD superfamily hydrolase (TIGR01549 family)
MRAQIKHIWFDMEGTLALHTPEWDAAHDKLLLETYAEVTNKPPTAELWQEYSQIYMAQGTHSAAFRSLGLDSDFWQQHFANLDEETYYKPDERVYGTLAKLRDILPVSVFTNAKPQRLQNTLRVLQINAEWFTHLLTGDDVTERKPSLEGFYKIIDVTKLPPEQILYIGDRVQADIVPAQAVGMKAGFAWGVSDEADYNFQDFTEILQLFE